jgi:hypothetical protein
MGVQHFLPHCHDLLAQHIQVTRFAQYVVANDFKLLAYLRIAGTEACSRQRLVFPNPSVLLLIFGECGNGADQQAASAFRAQA